VILGYAEIPHDDPSRPWSFQPISPDRGYAAFNGLAWFENVVVDGECRFREHAIMGELPHENEYGVAFSQLHALTLADVDRDGILDIVTGKRFWAHQGHDPGGHDPPVSYWFKTTRGKGAVRFIPHLIDINSGVGTQVVVSDLNGDLWPDLVVGNKKGTFALLHHAKAVDQLAWQQAQPKAIYRKPKAVNTIGPSNNEQGGLSPTDAAATMTVPEGFSVQLYAGEPDVKQPIAMTMDDRGRIWIAEAYEYPRRAPDGEGRDRIVIFEDQNGDGQFDKRTIFTDNLNLVSGLEVGFGGVWVGAAPYLLFIPDRDGDDVPDGKPEVLLDGWGYQDTHETINSFLWGPDGWLYGCHGVFTHSLVGKPGAPEDQRQRINAGVWRYHPTRHVFEVFAHGTSNPWGIDFDDHGQVCFIDWYDMQQSHRRDPSEHDRANGRIFRISYQGTPPVQVDLKKLSDERLVELQLHTNDWYSRHARRILQERATSSPIEKSALKRLVEIARSHQEDSRRLRALWVLHVTGNLSDDLVRAALSDINPYVRGWAIQLALEENSDSPATGLLEKMSEMAQSDPSPVVRLYLASACQRIPLDDRWNILEGLSSHEEDADDHNLPLMYWYAAEPLAEVNIERALVLGLSSGNTIPQLRDFMIRRIGRLDSLASLTELVRALGESVSENEQLAILAALRQALEGRRHVEPPANWDNVYGKITDSDNSKLRMRATALGVTFGDATAMKSVRQVIRSDSANLAERREALKTLLAVKDPQLAATLRHLLAEPGLRDEALRIIRSSSPGRSREYPATSRANRQVSK
jgi:hypothetical protein